MNDYPGTVRASRRVELINPLGLHLRAAHTLATLAQGFRAEIRITSDGKEVDGKSVLGLLGLAAACGCVLDLRATGPDADEALSALAELVACRFHETDEGECPGAA